MKHNVKIGDIFTIRVDEKQYCFGQVIGNETLIIFDIVSENDPELDVISRSPIAFLAHIVDVKIEDGQWKVIGNTNIPNAIVFPEYKVETPSGVMVMNYKGEIIRPANELEITTLSSRKSYSPAVLEGAVKSKFVGLPWKPYYNELVYKCSK